MDATIKTLKEIIMSDEQMQALRERNEVRMKEAKEKLGEKWTLHPANAVKINKEQRILNK